MPDYAVTTAFRAVDKMSPVMNRMSASAEGFKRRMFSTFAGLASTMGAVGGVAAIGMGIKKIVTEAANFENSVSSFTTLLGGSEKAAGALVKQLQTLGAVTPFEFKDLSDATSMLLGFNAVTKDTAINTVSMLGDLAQGSAEKLKGISLVYGQIMAGGKMMGQDFNQLINQQVPIAQGLAKVWNVDVNTAIKRIKSGSGVMASDVQKAMQLMTSEGGLFYKGMERASQTLTGRWSTFMDAISLTAAEIGNVLMPSMKTTLDYGITAMEFLLDIVKSNADAIKWVISFIPKLVAGFIAYKVVLKAVWTYQKAMMAMGWIKYLWMMRASIIKAVTLTKGWAMAQQAVNFVMTANPIGILIVAIAALIGYIAVAIQHWDSFGQSMALSLGPIGQVVSTLKELYDNWDKISTAFSEAGFTAGVKALGETGARAAGVNLIPENRQAPNQATSTGGSVSMQGEININGAPAGSTASAKTRGPGTVNMNLLGANP